MPPPSLINWNAAADERSAAASPTAASVVWNRHPAANPSAAVTPAARPWLMPRASPPDGAGLGAVAAGVSPLSPFFLAPLCNISAVTPARAPARLFFHSYQ